MIRFVHIFNYSANISVVDGEKWYLNEHVPRAKKLPGVINFLSWRAIDPGIPYPHPASPTPFNQFVRRSELIFKDINSWYQAIMIDPDLWIASKGGKPGFREFECMLLTEEPQFNLLRDAPPQQYKYMTLPLWWPNGRPAVDMNAEIFIDTYCIRYNSKISEDIGEDWYLGHHTREGKQLPGLKHYKTWKTIYVSKEIENSLIKINKWYRLTELGMSIEAFNATMVNKETRIRFTPSPFGNVIDGWLNIGIKLEDVEDFMK
ncbi:MAG: hypothetical protein ACFFKA_20305 [Candidatus Thorarchaeota archaeon]